MFARAARLSTRPLTYSEGCGQINTHFDQRIRKFSSHSLNLSKFQVGDRILLRWKSGKTSKEKLTLPLRENGDTIVENIAIKHKDIIGKPVNTRVAQTSANNLRKVTVRACHPTFDEFTSLAPRRVAPIYGSYASTIVSLLDIHNEPPTPENDPSTAGSPSFQILEAGTGHGSLTMQLSRAIAAANPPVTQEVKPFRSTEQTFRAGKAVDDEVDSPESEALTAWRASRRSVVHTVDIDPLNRKHADQLIRSYRGATYWPHIDFHVGNVRDWVGKRLAENGNNPFLDVAVLDMPGVEAYITSVVPAIKDRGVLLVFAPQITQIATCVQEIATENLRLKLDSALELGEGISTGRPWRIQMASLKHTRVSKHVTPRQDQAMTESEDIGDPPEGLTESVGTIPPMVCRPNVGQLMRGGGFIGLWKKTGGTEETTS